MTKEQYKHVNQLLDQLEALLVTLKALNAAIAPDYHI